MKTAELLFGVGKRAVEYLRLAVRDPHRGSGRCGTQTAATPEDTRLAHGLHVRAISAEPVFLLNLAELRPARLGDVIHQCVFHLQFLPTIVSYKKTRKEQPPTKLQHLIGFLR